jgi:hypothetical protein
MENYNFLNENMGHSVATNGKFVVVGNPNSKTYNVNEQASRTGEVLLYFNDIYSDNYSLLHTFKKPYLETLISMADYTPVDSAYNFNSGSYNHNKYGTSVDISDKYVAVGDYNFLQKIYYYSSSLDANTSTASINLASVEIYKITESSSLDNCDYEIDRSYVVSNTPVYSVTGSVSDQFAYKVSLSNNYLLVGSPGYNNDSGSVSLYKLQSDNSYNLITVISSSDSTQSRFGASLAIDKKTESKLIVGSDSNGNNNKVFVYSKTGNDVWELYQTLSNNTSSRFLTVDGGEFEFYPISQSNQDKYGYSVDIEDDIIVVGAPNDLIYYEYNGSNKIRSRGSFYVYSYDTCVPNSNYTLYHKSYGDTSTFKDNMLGYDVSISDKNIAVTSPKPYFPFSSLYISASIDKYDKNLTPKDFGEKSFNGQVLLYNYNTTSGSLNTLTTIPVNYRKKLNEPFSAFGHSVDLSTENLVIGSPIPVNDDNYLNRPFLLEQSASAPVTCTDTVVNVIAFIMEDEIINESGEYITASLVQEQLIIEEFTGRTFVYDFANKKTNYIIGNSFYNNSKVILNNNGNILDIVMRDPTRTDYPYVHMKYSSQMDIYERQYICTMNPGEFNVSSNISALNVPSFEWNVYRKDRFDFQNLDIILRYINSKITTTSSENWESTFVSGEIEQSIFDYYSSTISDYSSDRLTSNLNCDISNIDLDVNGDSKVNILDGYLIWKYFCNTLSASNFKNYITQTSTRKQIDDILSFLNEKCGRSSKCTIKDEFFEFSKNSSSDITGSYLAPYITTVGLYSGSDLVAIAKLGSPIKNTGEIPINIVIKWDI